MFKQLASCLLVAGVLFAGTATAHAQTRIQGGGASFPGPIYAIWTAAFNKDNQNVKVDYQPSGSGAGIKGITDRTLMFAGSDAPMTPDQEKKLTAPALHIPTVAGPVVMIYNLPDFHGELTLDGPTIAGIYLGQIKTWNDPALKKLNPSVELPAKNIIVVHREDNSGTSYIFTNYLSLVSPEWATKVGFATGVAWPVGMGGKSNKGVAEVVRKVPGGIGYVELAYANSEKLTFATQINKAGKAVRASVEGVVAAATESLKELPADLKLTINDAPGENSYPIAGFTYLLVYQDLSYLKDKSNAEMLLKYIEWCVTDGQKLAKDAGYAKLPDDIAKKVDEKIRSITFDGAALLK